MKKGYSWWMESNPFHHLPPNYWYLKNTANRGSLKYKIGSVGGLRAYEMQISWQAADFMQKLGKSFKTEGIIG